MKIEEFVRSELELVTVGDLEVGDIFSFVTGKHPHSFCREVVDIKKSFPEMFVIRHYLSGWGNNTPGRISSTESGPSQNVLRIKKEKFLPYNPEQQPYNEDDI